MGKLVYSVEALNQVIDIPELRKNMVRVIENPWLYNGSNKKKIIFMQMIEMLKTVEEILAKCKAYPAEHLSRKLEDSWNRAVGQFHRLADDSLVKVINNDPIDTFFRDDDPYPEEDKFDIIKLKSLDHKVATVCEYMQIVNHRLPRKYQ